MAQRNSSIGLIPDDVVLVFPKHFVIVPRTDYVLQLSGLEESMSVWLRVHPIEMGNEDCEEMVICWEADYPGREHDFFFTEILNDTPDLLKAVDLQWGLVTLRR